MSRHRWTVCVLSVLIAAGTLAGVSRIDSAAARETIARAEPKPAAWSMPKDPTNAALVYQRAWLMIPGDFAEKIGNATPDDLKAVPTNEALSVASECEDFVRSVMRAARIDACDWGVEYSQGFGALLPELGKMRMTARALKLDAARQLHRADGPDPRGASERIITIMRMARHAGTQHLLISSLVGCAVSTMGMDCIDDLIAMNKLSDTGRDVLVAELKRSIGPDAYGITAAIRNESAVGAEMILDMIRSGASPKQVANLVQSLSGATKEIPGTAPFTKEDIVKDLEKCRGYYEALLTAWQSDDKVKDKLADLERRTVKGEFGFFVRALGPAMTKAYDSHAKVQTRLIETIRKLENYKPPTDLPPARPEPNVLDALGAVYSGAAPSPAPAPAPAPADNK